MDAPPGPDAGHASGDALVPLSATLSPSLDTPIASQQQPAKAPAKARANGTPASTPASTEQMAAHHRILALNKAWKEKRARQLKERRDGEHGDSSSDTDSDSSSDVELPWAAPAVMPRLRPSATPQATASPGQLHSSLQAPSALGSRISNLSAAPSPSLVLIKRPANAPPCVSQTPVPLPEFPRPPGSAKPPPAPFSTSAVGNAAASPTATSNPSSSFSSSSSPSVPTAATPQRAEAGDAARAQALHFTEALVLEHLQQAQAESTTSKAPATSVMRFPTPGELLAKIRQSAAESGGDAPTPTPPDGSSSRGSRRSSNDTDGQDAQDVSPAILDDGGLSSESPRPSGQDHHGILLETADGRLYTLLKGTDGPDEPGRGALFPTNYKLHPDPPQFICPVRDCRRLMRNMASLGGHFGAKHCYSKFNDNLDGTLSLVATYKNANSMSPAIIVSRNPLPPDAPPAAEPCLPIITAAQQRRRLELQLRSSAPAASPSAAPSPARVPSPLVTSDIPAPAPEDGLPSDVCRYLHKFLPKKHAIPTRQDVRYMIHLPRRRSLPQSWLKRHRGERLDVPIYAAALAYLVGDEVTGPEACTLIYQAGRLSLPCVALPSSMPEPSKCAFFKLPTCIGCFYRSYMQRQRNICKWAVGASVGASVEAGLNGAAPEKTGPGLAEDSENEVEREETEEPTIDSRARTLASTRQLRLKRPAADASVSPAPKAIKLSVAAAERPEAMLEMEPWEMAPGRLTEENGTENVAFSGAFLTSAQPIPILPDIGIHVIVAKPGSSKRWGAEANKVRACTVAAGKVRVKIGETSFLVGLNGAFHIKPGQSCLVENSFYLDATIHCFSVKDYELVSEEH
ncbi:hypothetical protein HRG_000473 [Hirsutella rhossiliensis]|uniref:C2H2-type domain-containing protein n=1 Tax=Hirsutella rhossiliensis TaxID=111463 RepID=A0A9P8SMB5_9HYPO|nr:uncharacterized protein HRG_00473 [Hirsutella rhossiliensis]KAH0967831.1 hypothetical protein HRG_00473 [Hirsutella rhossiliensis]